MKHEFRLCSSGDKWGDTMNWLFNIAEEIHFNRGFSVPEDWEFKPSPLGPQNDPNEWVCQLVVSCGDAEILHFGKLLNRYANLLKKHNLDY